MRRSGLNRAFGLTIGGTPGSSPGTSTQALLIVDEGTGSSLNVMDTFVKSRMESIHGHQVTVVEEQALVAGDLTGKDYAWIAASIFTGRANVVSVIKSAAINLCCCDSGTSIELDMSDVLTGTVSGESIIIIENDSSPLAAGYSNGGVAIYTQGAAISRSGGILNTADRVGYRSLNTTQRMIWAYDNGATMHNSFVAPAKRAGFYFPHDISSETILTQASKDFFDAMINYLTT